MPYVNRHGNAWVCWGCIGGRCSQCINMIVNAPDEMKPCDCTHPVTPGWVQVAQRYQQRTRPVVTEHHSADTGPVPVIRAGRGYANRTATHRRAS